MMLMKKYVVIVLAAMAMASCGSSSTKEEGGLSVIEMDIEDAKVCNITKADLIPLETSDSSLIYDICELVPTADKWIVQSRSYIRVFDKATGKYLYNISCKGQGPGEYLDVSQFSSTGDTLHVLDLDKGCIHDFLSDGSYLGSRFDFNEMKTADFMPATCVVESPVDSTLFIINSFNGGYPEPLSQYSVMTRDGRLVKHVPGRKLYDGSFTPDRMYTDFEHGRVLAWEQLRDTLFSVTEDGVEPIYVFDFGKNKFPVESQQNPEFYFRAQDFSTHEGEYPYASFLKYYQVKGDNLYFSFGAINGKDTGVSYLGVVNERDHRTKILHYESEDGRYKQQPFFKVVDDKVVISVSDTENAEENPMLLVLPIDSL